VRNHIVWRLSGIDRRNPCLAAWLVQLTRIGSVKVEGGSDLHAQGNIVDHEYTIERDGGRAAEVSKRWFRVRDTYGVEVVPGENDVLILAITAVIDTMAHPDR
jgi:uncharacterized protein YxjI